MNQREIYDRVISHPYNQNFKKFYIETYNLVWDQVRDYIINEYTNSICSHINSDIQNVIYDKFLEK